MLEAYVLNTSFDIVAVIDNYKSFIWTERYFTCGDFELYLPASLEMTEILKRDNYIQVKDSSSTMVIEDIQIETNAENGSYIKVTGRSLESLLDRRVIWDVIDFTGNLQTGVKKILNDNVISPSNSERKLGDWIFVDSTDSRITSLTLDTYLHGEYIYDVISNICIESNIGFRVSLSSDKKFIFELYKGLDRTYDQEDRPYVVFSPEFDNILTSTYYESSKALKNCAIVFQEGGMKTITIPVYDANNPGVVVETVRTSIPVDDLTVDVKSDWYQSGMFRREMFVETNMDNDDDSYPITSKRKAQMTTAGKEELADTNISVAFDTSLDPSRQFVYGIDFFIGDVVQVKNEYGYESKARVTEMILSYDESGEQCNPTFTVIENLE